MEDAIRTRIKLVYESVQTYINSAECSLKQINDDQCHLNELELIESKLKAANNRFVTEINNYCKLIKDPNQDDVSHYTAVQIKSEDLIAELNVYLKQNRRKSASIAEDNLKVSSKLPQIELAKFDGNILKWYQFWDQFSSNIDSRCISEVDKLLYLQSVLEGEAKQAIDGLDTTNTNYKIAVTTLKERYGKPSVIIDAHYVALYRIKTANKSIKECRQVLNEIERHLRVLSSLGENVNHNHLRVMIIEKFPEDLIYELRLKLTDENESIDIIRKHLEYIISARETSCRLKRDTGIISTESDNIKRSGENFTLESLHVRTEENPKNYHKLATKREKRKIEYSRPYKTFKSFTRKRPHDNTSNRNGEPSVKRFRKKCIFCNDDHFNDECSSYKTVQERKSRLGNRCYNCFGEGHRSNRCYSKRKCSYCNKYGVHNRALCPNKAIPNQMSKVETNSLHVRSSTGTTLLQTSIVTVIKPENETKELKLRLLLDSGSQRSYITKQAANFLELSVAENVCLSIFTFGSKSPHQLESPLVNFTVKTRTGVRRSIYANVVPYITNSIRAPILENNFFRDKKLKGLLLADDGSCGDKIDVLIGNDYYHSFMCNEKISITKELFLVNTNFGWVWSGKIDESTYGDQLIALTYFQTAGSYDNKLNEPDLPLKTDDVKRLWDLESIGITDSPTCSRDEEAVRHFNETIQYNHNRYYVKWPWTEYPPNLPNNLGLACGRLNNLLNRLDTQTIKSYDKVIMEQLDHGIIEIVPEAFKPENHPVHYLPHHCVFNRDKPDKLRIVYDASAKTIGNQSLNECLYRGPLMLEDLTALIIKFREYAIGIVADVEKAFLQVGLQESDKDVTRFLWLKNIEGKVNKENMLVLRFRRVPFGVISSPFLLNATIKYHLTKSSSTVTKQIADDIYVDNIVTGAQTVTEAKNLYIISKDAFNGLSMNLREWNSNSKEFISFVPDKFRAKDNQQIKVLGLTWDVVTDNLYLKYNFDDMDLNSVKTKRDILKIIASVYDPCGFAIPIVLPAKVFFQKLWKQKISWDTKLSDNLLKEWKQVATLIHYIKLISVNRYYLKEILANEVHSNITYELHCFTDASMEAYAACIYLRSSSGTNNIVSFIIGKSRLVPIKDQVNLQIPKLELLGVLIGSRLLQYINKVLRSHINKHYLWTDSQVVLGWYNSNKLLPPFVSRRINEIKQNKNLIIKHIPSQYNPADVGTRPDRADRYDRWLKGPDFLLQDSVQWQSVIGNNKNKINALVTSVEEGLSNISNDSNFYESKGISDRSSKVIETDNIQTDNHNDELRNIMSLQNTYFPKEMKGEITDFARSLGIYKDRDGLLRCKGRFRHTNWTHSHKEPILLPKNADFTRKIIEDIHVQNYHVGISHTLALLRKKFWVPHGRSTVQKVLKKCQKCLKYGGGPFKLPSMPDLPSERVTFNLPFTFTGLDYFGPLLVENGIKEKRWVCLFTCLSVRAIHLEVVKDLSSEECLLAIRRFVAVRGLPSLITSDNAPQFKLTADVLSSDYCIQNKIRWKFIPELAPWFGGFYERLIGLVKHCLKRTLDKHLLNHNQLCTVLKEVEAIINTRPLTTVGAELEHVLTPSDFLRTGGQELAQISDRVLLEQVTSTKASLIDGWKRGQIILEEFAKMFTNQYLTSLRERTNKHKQPRVLVNRIPKVGETVQIKADGNRANWKVGKIIELVKGSDEQIRVAKIKTSSEEVLTRSIGHLYPLEVDDGNDLSEVAQGDDTIDLEGPASNNSVTGGISDTHIDGEVEKARRSTRLSAIRARDKIKKWTSNLMIFNSV